MALALAAGLLLALAGTARGDEMLSPSPHWLAVVGGDEWRAENDFDVSWVNPWNLEVVGARWRLSGQAYLGPLQTVASYGISEIDGIQVPAAGLWYLNVWLRDPSGSEMQGFGASVTLRLDDAPPAVSFLPGDAEALPAQLVAAVADPLSGLADGAISYRRLDESRWTDLATAIRVGVFGTELAATPPELKPGTSYLFQAEARDRAGNLGTTTMRADGTPMELRTPPAAGAGSDGRDGRGGRGGGTGRTRLLVGLAGLPGGRGSAGERGGRERGGAAGRGSRGATVEAGEAALLRGALADSSGGLEGRRLRVVVRPARGSRAKRRVEPLTTGPEGRFELWLPPGPSRRLTVVFAGDENLRPARRRLELRVRAAVSLRAEPARLRTGERLRLEGRVGSRGARLPRAGKLVTISYWEREARRWRPVIVTRTDRGGRFRAGYRFRYVSGRARIRLRAEAPAESQWPYAPGASRPVTIEVHG